MLRNVYTLPDLIDLALTVPEIGAVNFNILHTILHTIVKELKITDIRPWCFIENPLLAQTALTKSKLKEVAHKRALSESSLPQDAYKTSSVTGKGSTIADDVARGTQKDDFQTISPQRMSEEQIRQSSAEDIKLQRSSSATETTTQLEVHLPSPSEKDAAMIVDTKSSPTEGEPAQIEGQAAQTSQTYAETVQRVAQENAPIPEVVAETGKDEGQFVQVDESNKKIEYKSASTSEYHEQETRTVVEAETPVKEASTPKSSRREHRATEGWKYTHMNMRVEAAEEGLLRLSNIVDIIADKLRKAEQRKKEGGPSSEELEAIDERLLELEEMMARYAKDHDLLMELQKCLNDMLAEFEAIKALAAQLKQMQIDISKKADKEETWAALALKGDLELVLTKVDQQEFETAIEELGEAIGLLGLKFTRKNDEWEERAAEIWSAIHGKMSRDIFDAAMGKVESRLTALMYGLRKLKKVVEDLLYPEASGVTRCILCRRPACISGLECLTSCDSPKRSLSDRSTDGDDPEKLKNSIDEAMAKRQKLEGPPYCGSRSSNISVPRTSSSYKSSASENQDLGILQMKLAPQVSDREAGRKTSRVPKLPDINGGGPSPSSSRSSSAMSSTKSKRITRGQPEKLFFTNKLLSELETKETGKAQKSQKLRYTAAVEDEPTKTKSISSKTSVDIMPDPTQTVQDFAPIRLMPDALRRDVLLSPPSRSGKSLSMTLSPLMFDTASRSSSTSTEIAREEELEELLPLKESANQNTSYN